MLTPPRCVGRTLVASARPRVGMQKVKMTRIVQSKRAFRFGFITYSFPSTRNECEVIGILLAYRGCRILGFTPFNVCFFKFHGLEIIVAYASPPSIFHPLSAPIASSGFLLGA